MLKKVREEKDLNYFGYSRPEMLHYIPTDCRCMLELGCGEGQFGSLVKENHRVEYHGIELFKDASIEAEKVLDKVYTDNLEKILPIIPDNTYDCIVCNDVLEHLSNPFDCIENLKKILKPGGYIVSSIPNVRYITNLIELLYIKDWKYKHAGGILDFTHLRFFTKKSISRMYKSAGFKIVRHEGIRKTKENRFLIFNTLSLGYFSDTMYLQFATVAKLKM